MDRRKSIKTLVIGSLSGTALAGACQTNKNSDSSATSTSAPLDEQDRMAEEIVYNKQISSQQFFTTHELATITVLADIIIPKDAVSGSASDVEVPAFIEFMVNDQPEHQIPLRGGLRWLDVTCLKNFSHPFKNCTEAQRLAIVEEIAYPGHTPKDMEQGEHFFTLMRNLTISAFYTTPMGYRDIGYAGNTPNQWNGVPQEVLDKHQLAYSEKELRECLHFD